MKQIFVFAAGIALAHAAFAQELVKIETRPGVTQSFFIANMDKRKPDAAALLLVGGGGNINFLSRSRGEFIRNGILPVIVHAPSDQQAQGMSDAFRRSAEHAVDMRAVLAEVKKRYPELPVFLVGISRSTISVVNLAVVMDTEIAGAVLSSSVFYAGGGRVRSPLLLAFNWSAIRIPLLLVHHVDNQCPAAPYEEAERLGRRFPLITVRGGKRAEMGRCGPQSAHGFFGKEPETVAAIAAWMLAKPFAREIQ